MLTAVPSAHLRSVAWGLVEIDQPGVEILLVKAGSQSDLGGFLQLQFCKQSRCC